MNISASFLFFKLFYYLANSLKEEKAEKFSEILGKIAFFLSPHYRKIVEENLKIAFKNEMDEKKIESLVKEVFKFHARNLFEFLRLRKFTRERIKKIVNIEGKENLDNALSKKKGVIIVSAHLSNWELGAVTLADYGYEIYEVVRELSDKKVNEFISKMKIERNVKLISRRKDVIKDVVKILKENKIIILALDQNAGRGGIFVEFFGKPASTFAGPIIISKRTGTPVLPVFVVREGENYKIIIEKEFELKEGENYSEFIRINLQNLTKIIEDYIRKYPEQWFWFHRRWKIQPD